ncbi:uncharacterized protein FSUBG_4255 [Fusarium subglutinans]|uniref:Uncharacterized protein n=1 Tax=Gibberella subglutinans TaxID=42677 RepID=A0A8H5Q405_GIBSU|nr:uncharacterized protein FSUBG_4255 [Fusarium subglutinans]KAF5609100.1 hypothetical protein FSUBG_4255 [Fusarium subglutinans]
MSQYELHNLSSQQNLTATHDGTGIQTNRSSSAKTDGFFKTLFRTIGLKVITFILKSNREEKPKVLIKKSRRVAIARCAVHVIPALLTIGLSVVNFVGFFIGGELQGKQNDDSFKLGLLQIATKVQELLIVASIGTVIFHCLRSEVMFGPGLPLGFLVSGYSFSSISYLLSPEFLGGLKQSWAQPMSARDKFKRRCFVALIIVGCLLALLAALATAVLMIPRVKDWNIGGGIYWLTGDNDTLWPRSIDANYYAGIDCATDANPFLSPQCPSSGYMPLFHHFDNWWILHERAIDHEVLDPFLRKTLYTRPALIKEANTWAFTAHHATAVLQDAVRGMHFKAVEHLSREFPSRKPFPNHLMWASKQRYEVQTHVPAARVLCNAHDMTNLNGNDLRVRFPHPDSIDSHYEEYKPVSGDEIPALVEIDVLDDVRDHLVRRGVIRNLSSSLNDSMFTDTRPIIIAPVDIWPATNASLGMVVLLENTWNTTVGPRYTTNVLVCSIDARWAKAKSVMSGLWDQWVPHEYHAGRVLNLVETELELQSKIGYLRVAPPKNDSLKSIRMNTNWYEMLSPQLPDALPSGLKQLPFIGTKMTTLEALFATIYHVNLSQMASFESVIGAAVVEGLSRCGLDGNERQLEIFLDVAVNESLARKLVRPGDPKEYWPKPKEPRQERLVLQAIYTGYVMTCDSWFDWIANIELLLYAAIALSHSVYISCKGQTSGAWDSILELVVLCQNSKPPPRPILANTSAGVHSFKTVRSMAWVEVSEDTSATTSTDVPVTGGELQLRIGDGEAQRDEGLKPRVGAAYGVSVTGYQALSS